MISEIDEIEISDTVKIQLGIEYNNGKRRVFCERVELICVGPINMPESLLEEMLTEFKEGVTETLSDFEFPWDPLKKLSR